MRIHLIQPDIAWEDKEASRARAGALVDDAQPSAGDLVALPEMFETGFSMNVERTADDGAGPAWLGALSRRHACAALGGFTALDPGARMARNRAVVLGPDGGEIARYDKVHPFSYGREAERFEGGSAVRVFEWGGARVCPLICYDLRFPELFRAGRSLGAEVFIVIANWPEARASHWTALLRARAIENQALVCGVNRAGSDPFLRYRGGSVAFDWQGEELVRLEESPGAGACSVNIAALREWRQVFPAWGDVRPALLGRVAPDGRFGPSATNAQKTPEGP